MDLVYLDDSPVSTTASMAKPLPQITIQPQVPIQNNAVYSSGFHVETFQYTPAIVEQQEQIVVEPEAYTTTIQPLTETLIPNVPSEPEPMLLSQPQVGVLGTTNAALLPQSYANSETPYFALATESASNWSLFAAINNVEMSGLNLVNAGNINAVSGGIGQLETFNLQVFSNAIFWSTINASNMSISTLNSLNTYSSNFRASSITTSSINASSIVAYESLIDYMTIGGGEIYFIDPVSGNSNVLQSDSDDLYWNNVLVATEQNTSSISAWSEFPALSTVQINNQNINQVSTLLGRHIRVSTIIASTIGSQILTTSTLTVSTINTSSIGLASARISSLTVGSNLLIADPNPAFTVGELRVQNNDLVYNNNIVATQGFVAAAVSNWSYAPAKSNIVGTSNQLKIGEGGLNDNIFVYADTYTETNAASHVVNITRDEISDNARFQVTANGGTFGRIELTAGPADSLAPIQAGGLINLTANSASGLTPAALSRINAEAATLTFSSGAIGTYVFIPGALNLLGLLNAGIEMVAAVGPVNVTSGTATTVSGGAGVFLNGGTNDVNITNTNNTKLRADRLYPYSTTYTYIDAIDNQNMSPSTIAYIASNVNVSSISTSVANWAKYPAVSTVLMANNDLSNVKNLQANYIYSLTNIDCIGDVSAFNGSFGGGISGGGPSLPITNSGYISLNTLNAVYVNKLSTTGAVGDGDLHTGTMKANAGIQVAGNVSCSNAVVGQIGAFSKIDSLSTIEFVSGATITQSGSDLLILNNISTLGLYAQVSIDTDGPLSGNTIFSDTFISCATVNIGSNVLSTINTTGPQLQPAGRLGLNTTLDVGQNDVFAQQLHVGAGNTAANNEIIFYNSVGQQHYLNTRANDRTIIINNNLTAGNGYILDTFQNEPTFSTIGTTTNLTAFFPSTNTSSFVSTLTTIPQHFASVFASTTQVVAGANTSTNVQFTTTDINVGGFTIGTSTITVPTAGYYEINLSYQFDTTSGGTNTAQFWLTKNGTAVANTNSIVTVANNAQNLGTITLIQQASAGDRFGSAFYSPDANLRAAAVAAGAVPAIPSIIASIKRLL